MSDESEQEIRQLAAATAIALAESIRTLGSLSKPRQDPVGVIRRNLGSRAKDARAAGHDIAAIILETIAMELKKEGSSIRLPGGGQ